MKAYRIREKYQKVTLVPISEIIPSHARDQFNLIVDSETDYIFGSNNRTLARAEVLENVFLKIHPFLSDEENKHLILSIEQVTRDRAYIDLEN